MKRIILNSILITLVITQMNFSNPNHTREMMMQVVDSNGNPISKTISLYINNYIYLGLYRTGSSTSHWNWTSPNANVACDIGDENTTNPTWAPIESGNYILKCENDQKFVSLYIPTSTGGDGDFNIKYQNGDFTLIFNNRGVSLGSTLDWNKVISNFKQLQLDGVTSVGTVTIGQGSSFGARQIAPYSFYLTPNQNYLFHADTNIFSSQKYHKYQDINDVENFREKNSGSSNFDIIANFNTTYSNVLLKNNWPEFPGISINNSSIQFKDPWLIDFKDPLYGNNRRNSGFDATFKQQISPFYPDYSTNYVGDIYKGVFLNQNPQFQQGLPLYSVKIDEVQSIYLSQTGKQHNFYFQDWEYDPNKVTLQYLR